MKVAIQLYSVKERMRKDGPGTMQSVAKLGYKFIEPFAHPMWTSDSDELKAEESFGLNMNRKEAKSFLDGNGISVIGAHYYYPGNNAFEAMCDYYASLGSKAIGSGGDFFPGGMDELKENWIHIGRHAGV